MLVWKEFLRLCKYVCIATQEGKWCRDLVDSGKKQTEILIISEKY